MIIFARVLCLVQADYTEEEREHVCHKLIEPKECDLHVFARNFRLRFQTLAEMFSPLARSCIFAWDHGKRVHTLRSELSHARERQALSAASAPGRAFSHHARGDVLRQFLDRHTGAKGSDPRRARRPDADADLRHLLDDSRCVASPLLACGCGPMLPRIVGAALAPEQGFALSDVVRGDAPARHGHLEAICDQPPAPLAKVGAPLPRQVLDGNAPPAPGRSRVGGNPRMTLANSKRKAWKAALGRTLTAQELAQIEQEVEAEWQACTAEQREIHREIFRQEARERRVAREAGSAVDVALPAEERYTPHFGLMCNPSVPIQPAAFVARHKTVGYPTDEQVYHDAKPYVVYPEDVLNPGDMKGHPPPHLRCHFSGFARVSRLLHDYPKNNKHERALIL